MIYNDVIKELGYQLLDDVVINKKRDHFYAYDVNGYIIRTTLSNIYKNKNNIPFIHKDNIYSIDNIKLWLLKKQ